MNAKLILLDRKKKPIVLKLKKLPMTLGRGREADLTVAHRLISREHCEFYEVEDTLCIRDLDSLNGIFVGDIQVDEAALESGDILTIGAARFEVLIDNEQVLMPPEQPDGDDVGTDVANESAAADSGLLVEILNSDPDKADKQPVQRSKPKAAKPTAAKPTAAKPKAAKPKTAKPKAAKPKAAKPKARPVVAKKKATGRPAAEQVAKRSAKQSPKTVAKKAAKKAVPVAKPAGRGKRPRELDAADREAADRDEGDRGKRKRDERQPETRSDAKEKRRAKTKKAPSAPASQPKSRKVDFAPADDPEAVVDADEDDLNDFLAGLE